MKIIALGDIHGRENWKRIVEKETFDKIVFIGDYFDSREEISAKYQVANFNQIVKLKRDNLEKVILLTGNHDFQYLPDSHEKYSGFQQFHQKEIREVLKEPFEEELLQMCFIHANMLFSHAGVTQTWCRNSSIDTDNLESSINELFINVPSQFGIISGANYSGFGDEPEQPPTWVRPDSLEKDKLPGYVHIVGHTIQDELRIMNDIVLIDTLGTSQEYLVAEDEELYAQKVWNLK